MANGAAVPPDLRRDPPSCAVHVLVDAAEHTQLTASDGRSQCGGQLSLPGCVLASPSWPTYPGDVAGISEDYVFNWTDDATIVSGLLGPGSSAGPD